MLAVVGALFANGVIAILKLAAAIITGSSGMMAEALHSFADTANQVFLLFGLRSYKRPPTLNILRLWQGTLFLVVSSLLSSSSGSGATYALYEGYLKTVTSAPTRESGMGLLGLGHFLCVGIRLDCSRPLAGNARRRNTKV